MRRRRALAGLAALLAAGIMGGDAIALTDEEIFRDFRFNFLNPGARAVALGGAFVAAADDSTAAQANPAALHYVDRMEVFAEYRAVDAEDQVFKPSQAHGSLDLPTPVLPFLDLTSSSQPEDQELLSFASFTVPFRIGESHKMRMALSRQVVLSEKTSLGNGDTNLRFASTTFPIWVDPADGQPKQYFVENTVAGALDAEILHYNFAFATSLTADFSIGVTATYATLDARSTVSTSSEDPLGIFIPSGSTNPRQDPDGDGLFAPVVLLDTSMDGSDSDVTYSVGLHWHPDKVFPSGVSPMRFGAVYRKGATLAVPETATTHLPDGSVATQRTFDNVFKEPDRFSVGFSYSTEVHWTFALDVERILYSQMLEGFEPRVNFFTSDSIPPDALGLAANDQVQPTYTVDDATVVHAGVEYVFGSWRNWYHALRGGYYNAPDNRIRMESFSDPSVPSPDIDALFLDAFRGGEDEDHYTVGFAILNKRGFELQFAGDFADSARQLVASLKWFFGRAR